MDRQQSLHQARQWRKERYRAISRLTTYFAYAFRLEEDGRLRREWVAGAFTAITGYSPGQIAARGGWQAIVHPDDLPIALHSEQMLHAGQPHTCEFRIITRTGQVRWLSHTGQPVWDHTRERIVRILGAGQDITKRKEAEYALRQREHDLETLTENAPDIIARFDRDLRHLYVNRAVEQATGLARDSFLGKTNAELGMPAEIYSTWYAAIRRVFDTDEHQTIEFSFPTPTGIRWYQSRLAPEYGPDGTVTSVLAITRDITETKRAESILSFLAGSGTALATSLDFQETLTSLARLAVPFLADCCTIDLLEEESQELHQAASAHVTPERTADWSTLGAHDLRAVSATHGLVHVVRTHQPEIISQITDDWLRANAYDDEHLQRLRGLGSVSAMIVPLVARERTLGAITFWSTESGRYYSASDLPLAEDLAYRAALAIDNARLFQEAQQTIHDRDMVLSSVSHDLKAPLAAIRGYAQFLLWQASKGEALTYGPVQGALAGIESATSKMMTLIRELTDVATLQAGQSLQLERQEVDLVMLAHNMIVQHERATRRHRFHVNAAMPALVGFWDATRLERVLTNLLSNAVKYSPEGGDISVTLNWEEDTQGSWAVVRVQDSGLGIPAHDLPRVFERFHRASNVASRIRGTGVGLTITRDIVEHHGGSITVESQEGEGATFTVRLPITTADDLDLA